MTFGGCWAVDCIMDAPCNVSKRTGAYSLDYYMEMLFPYSLLRTSKFVMAWGFGFLLVLPKLHCSGRSR